MRYGLVRDVRLRAVDSEARRATFVAATERGVESCDGPEHLQMAGARLERYAANPVVLDSHNRYEAGAVVGRASVSVEGAELVAEVEFARTSRAEEVWELVRTGFLRALSVGFVPGKTRQLKQGESQGEIQGPARIVDEWELFEISVVPVPADAAALRRSQGGDLFEGFYRYLQEARMTIKQRDIAEKLQELIDSMVTEDIGVEAVAKMVLEAAQAIAGGAEEEPEAEAEEEAPPEDEEEEPAEMMEAAADEARARRIRALAPRGLEAEADRLVLAGRSVDEARKALLAAHAQRAKPAGTPEPGDGKGEATMDADLLLRSICN